MTDREKMEKLDDIGFIGIQEKVSPRYQKFIIKKTGEIIYKMKEENKKLEGLNKILAEDEALLRKLAK